MVQRPRPDLRGGCAAMRIPTELDQPVSFYYAPKGESPENLALMRRIDELFLPWQPPDGRQLRRDGVCVGRHRVRRLMRLMGLEAIIRRREPARRR